MFFFAFLVFILIAADIAIFIAFLREEVNVLGIALFLIVQATLLGILLVTFYLIGILPRIGAIP